MKRYLLSILLVLILRGSIFATIMELVNAPTSNTLAKGFIDLNFKMYNQGGMFVRLDLGLNDRLTLGTSLDIEKAIGNQKIRCDFPPFISGRYRILDGNKYIPAIVAIGYNPLGYSIFNKEEKIEEREFKGVYISFTKPILPFGFNGHAHGGINIDTHYFKDSKLYLGMDIFLNPELLLLVEVNSIKLNGERDNYRVHAGIRYAINQQFEIEVDFKDLSNSSVTRQIKIRYLDTLF